VKRRQSAAIVGVAQLVQRPGEHSLHDAMGPIELMVAAARAAAADAGSPHLLARVGFVGVAGGWWRYRNPGRIVAHQLGCGGAATALAAVSGTGPQDLVGLAAQRITGGELDVALIVGGEARWTAQRLKRAGVEPSWITEDPPGVVAPPERVSGFPDEMLSEMGVLGSAAAAYAIFDDRLRSSSGRSLAEQRDHVAALWSGFSDVAVNNPHAWDRTPHAVDEIRNASTDNRMIAFPYTKSMVANNTVDMASALLLCSVEGAMSAGVGRDRMVFPQVVTSSHETWTVVARGELHESPALAAAGHAAFHHAGVGPEDFDHIDLYACFPSIVQMSSAALGLGTGVGDDRPLTVTGGLGFAAAPVGNAVGHSIAAMVERVRSGGAGLVHGNGGNATKHSFAVYGNSPPNEFAFIDVQEQVNLGERAVMATDVQGPAVIEAATVVYDRDGPSHVLAAVLDDAGARGWAKCKDADLCAEAEANGLDGTSVTLTGSGDFEG
jgi:acetyl-CoA C-acetyltransferase